MKVDWATTATEFSEQANESTQARYYCEVHRWAAETNITIIFFVAFDEPWKGNPDNPEGAEKHWGLFKIDRTPKQVMLKTK
jgi:exo-beta-1,3-glucanase (GH17 family)